MNDTSDHPVEIEVRDLAVWYGEACALKDIRMDIPARRVSAIIGPSGCGKSTFIRCLNRMNDLIPEARTTGQVRFHGDDLYEAHIDPADVRRRIGMVFQKPNPFPKSIYDNVAYGPRINGYRGRLEDVVEHSLRQAALWEEVRDKLRANALTLSGGQQQRLCIARALAVEPEVILMDEPCSALDPIATLKIEDLMRALAVTYTIVIVTHNMQQAARVSDVTAMMMLGDDRKAGTIIEMGDTKTMFTRPKDKRTEDYVSGRFG